MLKLRKLALILALLGFASPAFAAFTVVTSTVAGSTDHQTVTTSSIDTTGATLLVACTAHDDSGTSIDLSSFTDNKNNVWNLTSVGNGDTASLQWVSYPTSVGSGHTFTFNPPNSKAPAVAVLALTGTATNTFDKWSAAGAGGAFGSSLSNTMTPSADNSIIVACGAGNQAMGSLDAPFTTAQTTNTVGGQHYAVGIGYEIQTTATARNPNWNWGFQFGALGETAAASYLLSSTPSLYSVVSKAVAKSSNNQDVTTGAIDTTGATAFAACVGNDGDAGVTPTVTDSASNTWTCGTYSNVTDSGIRLCYVTNPTTSATHTFSMSGGGTNNSPSLGVMAFQKMSYAVAFDQQASNGQSAGSLTPTADLEPLVYCVHSVGNEAIYVMNSTATANSTGGGNVQPVLSTFVRTGSNTPANYNFTMGLFYAGTSAVNGTFHFAPVAGRSAEVLFSQGASLITCTHTLLRFGVGCE